MKNKKAVMEVEDIIRLLELLTLFNNEDDLPKIQGVIKDMITSIKKQANEQTKGVQI